MFCGTFKLVSYYMACSCIATLIHSFLHECCSWVDVLLCDILFFYFNLGSSISPLVSDKVELLCDDSRYHFNVNSQINLFSSFHSFFTVTYYYTELPFHAITSTEIPAITSFLVLSNQLC